MKAGSQALELARVFCILFMSYVHLYLFDAGHEATTSFAVMQAVLVDILGRSSVPLLSVASGFLMVGFFARRNYNAAIKQRFRTLIIPMTLWNAIAMVLFFDFSNAAMLEIINGLFAITAPPAQLHLAFLRDLMVLTCLTPIFIYAAKRRPVALGLIVMAIYLFQPKIWIVLRTQILFFYVLGVFLAVYAERARFPREREKIAIYAAALVVTAVQVGALFEPHLDALTSHSFYDNAFRRPVVALAMWCVCTDLARTRSGAQLQHVGRNMFLFFLSHALIFRAISAAYSRMPDFLHTQLIYNLVWLATPVAVLMGLNVALMARGRIFPPKNT